MRGAQRRASCRRRTHRHLLPDLTLVVIAAAGIILSALPVINDARSSHEAREVIAALSVQADETRDQRRMAELAQAQRYNARLGGASPSCDNSGLGGCNATDEDILELADTAFDGAHHAELPYEEQLVWNGTPAIGWLEIASLHLKEPLYHGTSDEVLGAGVGHLAWSSLPVGGVSSHCVLAAHSGMRDARMFDDLDQLQRGDRFVLHVLGDAYQYEVRSTCVVRPSEVQPHCAIQEGQDLCTLMTCAPYGINTHRLLVEGVRVPFDATDSLGGARRTVLQLDRRNTPLLGALAGVAPPVLLALGGTTRRRIRALTHRQGMRAQRRRPFHGP